MMVVRAQVLIVGTPEQKGAGHELERAPTRDAAEAAAAHIGDGEAAVVLDERSVVRAGTAAIIDDAQRAALEDGVGGHSIRCYAGGRGAHNRSAKAPHEISLTARRALTEREEAKFRGGPTTMPAPGARAPESGYT